MLYSLCNLSVNPKLFKNKKLILKKYIPPKTVVNIKLIKTCSALRIVCTDSQPLIHLLILCDAGMRTVSPLAGFLLDSTNRVH